MPDLSSTSVSGVIARFYQRAVAAGSPADQYVIPVEDKVVSYSGRAGIYRTPGRALTSGPGRPIVTLWNAAASGVQVDLATVTVDVVQTAIKAVTVVPPAVRIHRITAAPTGGSALTKMPNASSGTSNANVTLLQDASADGTASGTALAVTLGAMATQEFAPRLIQSTAASIIYEPADRMEFLSTGPITLAPGEGACCYIAYPVAASEPTTDFWIANIYWKEYTRP
jgi:hypothetical protein